MSSKTSAISSSTASEVKAWSISKKTTFSFVHSIAKIWYNHLNNSSNKCGFLSDNTFQQQVFDILKHIYIVGGATRDYILNTDSINDIDVQLNKEYLTNLHLNHLNKYHKNNQNSKINCVLYKMYYNKKTLDAQYFMELLKNSQLFKNKVTVSYSDFVGVYKLKVKQMVKYKEYNLINQELELVDSYKTRNDVKDIESGFELIRKKSSEYFVSAKDDLNNPTNKYQSEEKSDNEKGFKIDIHKIDGRTPLRRFDFAMNTVIVSFSDLIDANSLDTIIFDWNIRNSLNPNNGIYNNAILSVKNRVLNTPLKDISLSIKTQYTKEMGCSHFFRCIKFLTRWNNSSPKWKLDSKIIDSHIKFYSVWINDNRFANDLNRDWFIKNMITWSIKKPLIQHEIRFKYMKMFKFHSFVIPYFKKIKVFREEFLKQINEKEEKEKNLLMKLLKQYKYV